MDASIKDKLCVAFLKYVPILCASVMLTHVFLLLLGIQLCATALMVITIVSIMVIYWSCVFKFCFIHICASLYTIIVLWCCYIQEYIGFGRYLNKARIVVFCMGVFLMLGFVIKVIFPSKKIQRKNRIFKNKKK